MIVLFVAINNATAQDIQFSQFYANTLYLNPAFAGSTHDLRGVLHQRIQWPKLEAKYITSSASLDTYIKKTKGGVGLIVMKDWQGANTISSTDIALQYAQEVDFSPKFSMRFGLQGAYVSRNINYAQLTFPDQYTDGGYSGLATSEDFGANRKNFFDLSAGTVLYSDKLWLGISAHHINNPNQSFYNEVSRLPVKIGIVGGYKIELDGGEANNGNKTNRYTLTPTFYYKMQGKSDQLDLGIYGMREDLMVGFWYRGIPVKHYERNLQNNESMVVLLGWRINKLVVSYSYDFTISKLNNTRTGGSHEFNLTYIYPLPLKRKIYKRLPCPKF
ncbi:PorP/SprF family type IX secretion system membrane protein [Sporocytophaga myxococcoides]|uniref:PorP/SprF family type IX secretion system membrane protein n=1 Tax=Sporocytophaga myxococcoides TaxID=153721 RepID=UPI000685BD31|nr:type IX secretion system membrane protein PorP/SprF [Sporocytophaga myxococcoides]